MHHFVQPSIRADDEQVQKDESILVTIRVIRLWLVNGFVLVFELATIVTEVLISPVANREDAFVYSTRFPNLVQSDLFLLDMFRLLEDTYFVA